ncbi:hypothetical protein QC761_0047230 [Podospora bellae-mahoneyi]|uniref:Secreted protein n=1 Tax=Podospora bellae-mahoneyi TaxID=2093777 RepID=A0ABR0FLH1_9PEZI|nr:hypothetical protein QC761_0047230 [Podospora bellae-mahoneyi]
MQPSTSLQSPATNICRRLPAVCILWLVWLDRFVRWASSHYQPDCWFRHHPRSWGSHPKLGLPGWRNSRVR